MALEFFRRRQKMVIIVMVVLMVAFLVPSGVSMLMQRDPMATKIGQTRSGPITQGDRLSAQVDIDVLGTLGLGSNPYRYPPWPTEMEYVYLMRRNGEQLAPMAYALLLAEAKAAGILAGEGNMDDVDTFLAEIGYGDEDNYRHLVATLRSSPQGWTESRIRHAVRNWLLVCKSSAESRVDCPPSEAEVALVYRDVREQISVRALRLRAQEYLQDIPEPNEPAVRAHFDRYRSQFPGQVRKADSFAFGYRQPGRARLRYLFVRGDVIRRVTEPAFDLVVDYYNQNKGEFVRKVPASGPATGPAGPAGAATQPTQPTREVPMTFAEAKGQIIEKLRDEAARVKMDELAAQIESEVRRFAQDKGDPNQAYAEARKGMMRPADEALEVVLRGVKIDDKPLDEAVRRLAEAAGLRAICYPWGTHGDQTLLPSVKVSLKADGIRLRQALEEISQQVKWPRLTWAGCVGLQGVLFSVPDEIGRGVDFFPIQLGQTPPRTFAELSEDQVLGYAYANPAGGRTLAETVFSAEGLSTDEKEAPMARVGVEGARMYVMGDKPGRLLWRLLEVAPAHVPIRLDDRPGLRDEVVRDLKLQAAFAKALREAEKIKEAARNIGLETVASRQNRKTITTGLFARKTLSMAWTEIPELGLTTPEFQAHVIPKAFELVPQNVEPGAPQEASALVVVPVQLRGEVLVMERTGFQPLVRPEYEEFGRIGVARFIATQRQQALESDWFDLRTITRRVGLANP